MASIDLVRNGDSTDSQMTTRRNARWDLGKHSENPLDDRDVSVIDGLMDTAETIAPDMEDLLNDVRSEARSLQIRGFECDVCGLHHGHSDTKHDIREKNGLNVREEFAEEMEFSPFCHCGVNQLAMLVKYADYFDEPIFRDQGQPGFNMSKRKNMVQGAARSAKIGDHVHREIRELESDMEQAVEEMEVSVY